MNLQFQSGRNIAMKVPSHEHQDTVRFYRDVLRLKEISSGGADDTPRFEFGDKVLWLDCEPGISQSEIWLEIVTNDIGQAAEYLNGQGLYRRDDIEPLPNGFQAFWISNPSNIIHLLSAR